MTDDNKDHWLSVAERYEAEGHRFTSQFAEAAWTRAALPRDTKVLDIATGVGAVLLPALRDGVAAWGIDFSLPMVERARRLAAEIDPSAPARILEMDGQALTFEDASFDAVFSAFGIMLFPDPRRGLVEAARVLRPGGTAVILTWQSEYGAGPGQLFHDTAFRLFPDRAASIRLPLALLLNTPERIGPELVAAGLNPVDYHLVTRDWALTDPDWARKNAKLGFGWSPLWQSLDEDDRARLIDAVSDAMTRNPVLQATALVTTATKT